MCLQSCLKTLVPKFSASPHLTMRAASHTQYRGYKTHSRSGMPASKITLLYYQILTKVVQKTEVSTDGPAVSHKGKYITYMPS